jgi:hypothetical protein
MRAHRGAGPPDPGNATAASGKPGGGKAGLDDQESRNGRKISFQSLYRKRPTVACLVRAAILRAGGPVRP